MSGLPNDIALERELRLERTAAMLECDPPEEEISPENGAAIEELHAWAQSCNGVNLGEIEED